MGVKELYLLRHGDTGLHDHYIGATDVPLSEKGREQVRYTARLLQGKGVAQILCSPLLRCRQTLELLDIAAPCHFLDLLREIDFGRWEGKTFAEIVLGDKELVDLWVAAPGSFAFPGGEAVRAFQDRIASCKTHLETMAEESILVIAHGGVIRSLLCLYLGLDPGKYLVFDVSPGCFSSVRLFSEGGVLTGFNIGG